MGQEVKVSVIWVLIVTDQPVSLFPNPTPIYHLPTNIGYHIKQPTILKARDYQIETRSYPIEARYYSIEDIIYQINVLIKHSTHSYTSPIQSSDYLMFSLSGLMAHRSKQNQTVQRQVNDYEKIRLLRIEENQKKLRDLGVKSIANYLTSLVESQKIKKKIVKPSNADKTDADYISDLSVDGENDHQQVVKKSKKQHRSHYIAPLSMNKLAKQHRVIAPRVSQKFSLDSIEKENQSRETITMAELISSNKEAHRQKEVFKQNLTKPSLIKGGAKRRLVLIDEDDDEYDETIQDVEGVDIEIDTLNDNGNEGDKSQGISQSKKRGPTMLHVVHTRKVDDREVIICNEFGQPVGPVTNEKDIVGRFSRFLGTIARNHSYAPLIHSSWHKVPHKDKIWDYVLKRCLRAKEIRMSQKNMHTAGPKSFARIRDEMKNDDPNKDFPTLTKMFEQTRKRTEGRVYVDTYDDTKRKIEQMKKYKASENESASMDPFRIVMSKENGGYCRLYGRGVTNTLIKKMNGGDTTYMVPGGLVESFNESFDGQKHQLLEMKKELDEEHEKKKLELEAIQEDIKNQLEHLEATMRKLMEQLPHED
ncbi:hypothetical protein R6Q59_006303 [Mikania micrantha]